jgi:translin
MTLDQIAEEIRANFEELNDARDKAYQRSRALVSVCARAIRAVHREEWETAETLLHEAKTAAASLTAGVEAYPALFHAGYTQDALKEYVEAEISYALVRDLPLPTPAELNCENAAWLNGLAEAAMEMRRRILDILRHGHSEEAERLLQLMDEIYTTLLAFDFNDSITGGLRRRADTLRGVVERTRGDITTSFRQAELQAALEALEARLTN